MDSLEINKKLALLITLTAIGCVPPYQKAEIKKPVVEKKVDYTELPAKWDLLNLYPNLKSDEFPKEISRLESMLNIATDPSSRARMHLKLGLLHLDGKNPNASYTIASKELESYLSMDPRAEKREEVQNLIRLLGEIGRLTEENKKGRARIEQVAQENQEIKKENLEIKRENQLEKKENQELKNTVEQLRYQVEQLKSLDVNIEKRRRRIK